MTGLKYFAAPFIVWAVSQTLKVFYRILIRKEEFSKKHIAWIYVYGDGAPSTHSALLAAGLTIIWMAQGVGLLFYLFLTVSLILGYNLFEDRKKQTILEAYFRKSGDPALRQIPADGILMDISGHGFWEIIAGMVVGGALGVLIAWF